MENEIINNNRNFRGWIIAAVVILLVVISARFVLKSDWLFNTLRKTAVQQIEQQLNGSLSVGSIRGDLLSGFTVRDITLRDTASARVAQIDSLNINYDVFPALFSPHTLNSVELFGVDLMVEQYPDSTWNLQHMVSQPDQATGGSDPFFWKVENLVLSDANIELRSDQYLPDGRLSVNRINASLSAGILEYGLSTTLRELEFAIKENRLPDAVEVYLAGAAHQKRYTLDSIVINTGRSIVRGSAYYDKAGQIEQTLKLTPLSWRDLSGYAADLPLAQNLQIELSAEGTLENLKLTLEASAEGLQELIIQAESSLRKPTILKGLDVSVQRLNTPVLTGIEHAPVIQSLKLDGTGTILLRAPSNSSWEGSVDIENASYRPYRIDSFQSSYAFVDGSLNMDGELQYLDEEIQINADVDSILSNRPYWNLHAESRQVNPAGWLQDDQFVGVLNFTMDAMGSGFNPADFSSSADITISGGQFRQQPLSNITFSGSMNQNMVTGTLSGQLRESHADVEFTIHDWQSVPVYEFEMEMNRLNFAEFRGMEEFPTYINGTVEGSGTSFDSEQMTVMATANFDSSIVNGEEIQELNTDIQIKNEFVIVEQGLLQSPIADASFSLNQHLFDLQNRSNRFHFKADLKDLSPLAPLFSVEKLRSEGTLSGNLGRNAEEILEFNGFLDLKNVAVDTLFTSEQITGRVASYITDQPECDIDLVLREPHLFQKTVQDMQLYAYAKRMENQTIGNMSLQLQNGDDSVLRQSGEFTVDSTRSTLLTQRLDFETDLRELSLEKPFRITYVNESIEIDTMTISTDQGDAYLKFWAPRIDSLRQTGGLDARSLNIGILQETILRDSYFDGYLDGSIRFLSSPDTLEMSATALLTELKLSGGRMDSVDVEIGIKKEWLTAELRGWNEGAKLAEGSFQVPFLPGDPLTFDDEFFEREISGQFSVFESPLKYWLSFLPEGSPEGTGGMFTSNLQLGGIAGNPDIDGRMTVRDGLLSGIRVDTIGVDIAYLHDDKQLDFNGSIFKDHRQILNFEADLPFLIDLKHTNIEMPSNDDEVFVDIHTNNLDLALFNNYVNRNRIRNISGRLEGAVTMSGSIDNMQAEGKMELSRGSIRIVQAGITLSGMRSEIVFNRDAILLHQFTAKSGPGQVKANGRIDMLGLEPDQMDIQISANRFQMLNTQDYKAIIQMNATMSGTMTEPRLQGNLTFLNGFYYLQDFGERPVETVELDDENREVESFDFYESMEMEFTVAFNRQFYIRNQQYLDAEIEIEGRVDLLKEPQQDLELFGTLEGTNGYARPLGKEFTLEEGLVSFYGPVDNPELNIRTRYAPPQSAGVQIFYIIEGTLEEPEFIFDSQPPLELQDIISYTLFGRPFYELESWEQVVAGSGSSPTAADYAFQVLLDRVEMLASRRLGIDVVRIDNSTSGSNNTVIQTGWYLNQSTFFSILTEIDGASPKTLFMLEILLRENLELIITQGDDTRQGIDLQWKRDY